MTPGRRRDGSACPLAEPSVCGARRPPLTTAMAKRLTPAMLDVTNTSRPARLPRRRRRMVMAVLPSSARGPLPKIAPLLIRAFEESGWRVEQTYWGGRKRSESSAEKFFGRLVDLVVALSRLAVSPGAILFVNSSHSWRSLLRDIPLLAGARCMRHGSVVLLHGSEPELVSSSPRSPFALASGALVRCADAVMLLSTEELELWRESVPHGRYFLVSNPFEATTRQVSRTAHEPPTVLYVGRLMKAKGVFDLLEAFSRVRQTDACDLSLVGDGPDVARLGAWLREHGLTNQVRMCNYAEGPDLARRYDSADIFVLPTYWSEGFPTVLTEAMDAGLAIVTTRIRGMADHLVDGVNCLFVRPRDPEGLAAAVSRLLHDPDLRRSMGKANRQEVASFAPGVVVGDYLRALDYVAESRARGNRRR